MRNFINGSSISEPEAIEYAYKAFNEVDYAADKFPSVGKFVLEVLGHDICDAQTEYVAHVIMDNAKLSCDIDVTLNATTTDDFKLTALPPYCASSKSCFKIVIAE